MSSSSSPRHDEQQPQQSQPTSPPASLPDLDGPSSFVSTSSSISQSHDTSSSSITTADHQEKHPRARRKRTGAHDKMILEEAYRTNSKPDKHARLDLVSRVSLTEKEVQVWFQNRRQNDRRKSRPLTSEELANLHHSGIRLVDKHGGDGRESILKVTHGPISVPLSMPVSLSDPAPAPGRVSSSPPHTVQTLDASTYPRDVPSSSQDSQTSVHTPSSSLPTLGYLANRRRETGSVSTPLERSDSFSFRVDGIPSSQASTPQSQMRLSCSLDGKAELISGNGSPESLTAQGTRPPSLSSPRDSTHVRELRRSHSAMAGSLSTIQGAAAPTGVKLPSISTLLNPPALPRGPSGRSRDVEAWELCAASQTRDELTAMAEKESNGDALARISLIRSASGSSGGNNVLQPTSGAKRNAHLDSRRSHAPKRAKLSRAMSSVARLEGHAVDDMAAATSEKTKMRKAKKADDDDVEIWQSPNTESDKENQSPGRDRHPRRGEMPGSPRDTKLIPLQDSSARRANMQAPSRANRRGKDAASIAIFEDGGAKPSPHGKLMPVPRSSEEVERFMRGEVSPSKKGDMDVVTSLLSLSKGAWA